MKNWAIGIWIAVSCVSFFSCSTMQGNGSRPGTPDAAGPVKIDVRERLEKVVTQEIVPQLKQMSFIRRPTFIMAGKVDGTALSVGKIDDISRQVRKLINLSLLNEPGFSIVQRHRLPNLERRGSRPVLNCDGFQLPEYYLIIDTQLMGKRIYIDLIAQNIEGGNTVVPGSAISVDLKAEAGLITALKHSNWDEFLEGTARLPIKMGDKDAVAAYIGYNLVCLLKEIYYNRKGAGFYVDSSKLVNTYDKEICNDYLTHYLSSYELPLVSDSSKASHTVQLSVGQSQGVSTMWAEIRDNRPERNTTLGAEKVYYHRPEEDLARLEQERQEAEKRYKESVKAHWNRFALTASGPMIGRVSGQGGRYIGSRSRIDFDVLFDSRLPGKAGDGDLIVRIDENSSGISGKAIEFRLKKDKSEPNRFTGGGQISQPGLDCGPFNFLLFYDYEGREEIPLGRGNSPIAFYIDTVPPPAPESARLASYDCQSFTLSLGRDDTGDTCKYLIRHKENGVEQGFITIETTVIRNGKLKVDHKPNGVLLISAQDKALNESDYKEIRLPGCTISSRVVIVSDGSESSRVILSELSRKVLEAGYDATELHSGTNHDRIRKGVKTGQMNEVSLAMLKANYGTLLYIDSSVESLGWNDYFAQFQGKGRIRMFRVSANLTMQPVIDVDESSTKLFVSVDSQNPLRDLLARRNHPNSFQQKILEPLALKFMTELKRAS